MQDNTFSVKGLWGFLPDVNSAGICLLTALAEVSHPSIVSKTTDCDDMKALAALGTLVDFVMFVDRRASFATLIETRRADRSEYQDEDKENKKNIHCPYLSHTEEKEYLFYVLFRQYRI